MNSGIYMIYNWTTDEFYIGSSENLTSRFSGHRSSLRKGTHANYKLQQAFNLGQVITWNILYFCKNEDTITEENKCFDLYQPSINIAKDALAPMKGRKHSSETLLTYKGRKPWNRGIKRTKEEKALMSKRRKEAAQTQSQEMKDYCKELRKKQVGFWKGKNIPKEVKEKVRNGHLKLTKSIVCVTTGKLYLCQNDAAKDLELKQGHISEHLNGKRPNVKGYKFEYCKKS